MNWSPKPDKGVNHGYAQTRTGAANTLHRETEIGSLAQGKLADLVILSANPLETDPLDLAGIEVLMTMVGGQTAFCREGSEALCP